MNDVVLRVESIRLDRGERRILAGATFGARRGELVALMGPSGCGKTTLLRTIAGLERFQSGSIEVEGIALNGGNGVTAATVRAIQRKVGMVFQFHHLFEHMPAIKNVLLAPVHAYGVPIAQAERRARELLRVLGVEHRAAAFPRELSGGEAQRVAIARALAVDPPVLLMDEPTASLDAARRGELRELLQSLLRQGRTLVIATHDEAFARSCAIRVLRVVEGAIVEESGANADRPSAAKRG
jgi:polar amino acid transport system ATP-binding protein